MSVETVRGKRVLILFEGRKCIHSRHCVLGRPDVFEPNAKGEWIHPDQATPEEVAELAHTCPSGAITYQRLDGGPQESPPMVNVARLRENGPIALHAEFDMVGSGLALRATLCRCGASRNKPFCDMSHLSADFAATGEPPTQNSKPLAARNGPLRMTPQPNAALLLEGNLEICSGTGRTVDRTTRAFLCRCGQSSRKPFCDGTHKKVGFESE